MTVAYQCNVGNRLVSHCCAQAPNFLGKSRIGMFRPVLSLYNVPGFALKSNKIPPDRKGVLLGRMPLIWRLTNLF